MLSFKILKILDNTQDTSWVISFDLKVIDSELTHLGLDASKYIMLSIYSDNLEASGVIYLNYK